MVRRVFFSFHYGRDHWRANAVRKSWVTQDDRNEAGFIEGDEWEEVKKKSDSAIKRWIRKQMENTSVVAVIIGRKTADRRWVRFEIKEALREGKGIVGVRVHNIKDQDGNTDVKGSDPLDSLYHVDGSIHRPSKIFNTYNWVSDDGYSNFGDWVEKAAQKADR